MSDAYVRDLYSQLTVITEDMTETQKLEISQLVFDKMISFIRDPMPPSALQIQSETHELWSKMVNQIFDIWTTASFDARKKYKKINEIGFHEIKLLSKIQFVYAHIWSRNEDIRAILVLASLIETMKSQLQ